MASYIQLEPSSFRTLGIPDDKVPTFGGSDVSFYATSSFVYTLFFIAIVGAAFYEYILVGVYRMEASENGIRKSNETFKRTTWGLLGVFGLFLIIFTLNKDILTGDVGLSALQATPVATNQERISTTINSAPVATPPTPAAGAPTGSGVLASKIYSSAMSAKDSLSTANAPGTSNGRLACAYAVNKVLEGAGIAAIDRFGNLSVASMESGLQNGRGTLINQSNAIPGDIAVEANKGHVGICLNNGCTQVLSNSSSRALFAWVSGPEFLPSYQNGMGRIYRVNN